MTSSSPTWSPIRWPSSIRDSSPRWARRPRSIGPLTRTCAGSWRASSEVINNVSDDGRQFALQIRIGGFILAGLGVFFAIIYLLGAQARYFERKYDLIAEFTEVGGLIEGATVRLAGVQIGRVTRVVL